MAKPALSRMKLGALCDAVRGVTFASGQAFSAPQPGLIACLTTSAIQSRVRWENRRFIPRSLVSDEQIIRTGDILMSTANSKALVGKSCLIEHSLEAATFGAFVTLLRPKNSINAHLLAYGLQAPKAMALFFEKSSNTTNISNLRVSDLLEFEISYPKLSDQDQIAAVLNEQMAIVNGARESQAECLKLTTAFSTSYLQSIFPVGLGDTLPMPPGWRRSALGDASDVVSGVTVGRQLREPTSRRVPYLRVANVKDGYLDLAEIKQIEVTEAEFRKWRLLDGDILLTEGGDLDKLGRGTFWSEQIPDCIHQNHIFRVRFKSDEVYPPFAAALLGSPYGKAYFLRHAKKTTGIASINQKVLRGFPLLLPPISEQRRIAERLRSQQEAAAAMTAEFRRQSEALDRLPAALLRRAFEGSA
jgi:type I restriction enzyme S subunit